MSVRETKSAVRIHTDHIKHTHLAQGVLCREDPEAGARPEGLPELGEVHLVAVVQQGVEALQDGLFVLVWMVGGCGVLGMIGRQDGHATTPWTQPQPQLQLQTMPRTCEARFSSSSSTQCPSFNAPRSGPSCHAKAGPSAPPSSPSPAPAPLVGRSEPRRSAMSVCSLRFTRVSRCPAARASASIKVDFPTPAYLRCDGV